MFFGVQTMSQMELLRLAHTDEEYRRLALAHSAEVEDATKIQRVFRGSLARSDITPKSHLVEAWIQQWDDTNERVRGNEVPRHVMHNNVQRGGWWHCRLTFVPCGVLVRAQVYFYNTRTFDSTWVPPSMLGASPWSRRRDEVTGRTFYANFASSHSRWSMYTGDWVEDGAASHRDFTPPMRAVTTMQAHVRGRVVRRQQSERSVAAANIQRLYRGHTSRRGLTPRSMATPAAATSPAAASSTASSVPPSSVHGAPHAVTPSPVSTSLFDGWWEHFQPFASPTLCYKHHAAGTVRPTPPLPAADSTWRRVRDPVTNGVR